MPDVGPLELLLILAVILLLFGGAKLPQLARSLGQAKKEFQEGSAETPKKAEKSADEA
jgi:sec-independent protein translocase protein TatA